MVDSTFSIGLSGFANKEMALKLLRIFDCDTPCEIIVMVNGEMLTIQLDDSYVEITED